MTRCGEAIGTQTNRILRLSQSLVLGAAMLFPACAAAQGSAIDQAARELSASLSGVIDCQAGEEIRVGIFPFDEDRLPVHPDNAFALYERVLGGLIDAAPPCLRYIDGRGAFVTLDYLSRAGTLRETGQDHRAQIQETLTGVAYTIDGTILDQPTGLTALFRVTDLDSGVAVARAELAVPETYRETACGAGALPVTVASDRLARQLSERASDMAHLTVTGGYFGEGDAQTSFARYLEREIEAALTRATENVITGRTLQVARLGEAVPALALRTRGVALTPREFEEAATTTIAVPANGPGSYRMSLRYWVCEGDGAARLAVNLRGHDGRRIAEMLNISLAGLPQDVEIRPPQVPVRADWGPDGAYSFQMTSQRGPNPVVQAGDTLQVLFRTGRDSWLYCFYTDAAGQTLQLLPNPFQAGMPDANFYGGGRVHLFPDPERLPRPDPFDITITDATTGIEVFHCLATPEDVTGALPGPLRGTSLDPVPARYTTRLRALFEEIAGGRIAEARMTVTVMEDL
jgi:hypothetical protein